MKNNMFYDRKKLLLEIVPLAFILLMFAIAFFVYPSLPEKIPTHWNAQGQVDGYSGRGGIFIIPIMFLVLIILFFILPMMEVFSENMLKIYKYYYAFKIVFSVFFLVLFIATLLPNFGYDINVAQVVIVMISILFISIGAILPKLKRNYIFGIRTGWTLSSDKVWDQTHRLGGVLFIVMGVLTIISLFIFNIESTIYTFLALIILGSIYLVFYSYYLYAKENKGKKR
jgi:uncharacterized membrane protein